MTAGEFARKIEKPYTTVATWLCKGQAPGAIPQTIGEFRVWLAPESAVETFKEWEPKPGRSKKEASAKKTAAKLDVVHFSEMESPGFAILLFSKLVNCPNLYACRGSLRSRSDLVTVAVRFNANAIKLAVIRWE